MAMKRPLALWIYRAAWEPALWLVEFLAAMETSWHRKLWPPRWSLPERLGWKWPEPPEKPALWMHAASLGECKGLWALAQRLSDLPVSFVLTSNTTTGLDFLLRQISSVAESSRWRALLAPLDHPRIVRRFLNRFEVNALLLFEVELWPHFVLETRKTGRPVYWASARLTPRARRYQVLLPGVFRPVMNGLTWIQTQGDEETETLRGWGYQAVETGPDLRGLHYLNPPAPESGIRNWSERSGVAFISLHASELPSVHLAIKSLRGCSSIFVFPRKMEELSRFQEALEPLGFALHSRRPENPLLIVDSFGRVPEFLGCCHAAVIGGSFVPRGGHNLWEPLAAGVSMIIGPHHWNQAYLVHRLAGAGLLKITNCPLPLVTLKKSETDPGNDCRNFIEKEKNLLDTAVNRIFALVIRTILCP